MPLASAKAEDKIVDTGTPKMIGRSEDGIGWLIFNQPEKHNAVSYEMWLAVPKIVAAYEADPAVRVIVLTGAGERAFVSGADISEFENKRGSADAVKVYDEAGEAAHAALVAASKPTVSMISRHLYRRRPRYCAHYGHPHLLGGFGVRGAGGQVGPGIPLHGDQAPG